MSVEFPTHQIVRDSDLPTKIVAILVTSVQAAEMRIQKNQNPSASVSATSKTALFVNKHHRSFDIFYSKSLSHVKPLQVNIWQDFLEYLHFANESSMQNMKQNLPDTKSLSAIKEDDNG